MLPFTGDQIADQLGQALIRNLNHNVMKEDAEAHRLEPSNPPQQQEQPKKQPYPGQVTMKAACLFTRRLCGYTSTA